MKLEPLGFKHYVDSSGKLIGAFGGCRKIHDNGTTEDLWPEPPDGATEVGAPPPDADTRRVWDGETWSAPPASTPPRDIAAELDEARATINALLKQGTITREKIDAEKVASAEAMEIKL